MLKKLLHPKAVLGAVVAFHILVKAKALFLVMLGVPCFVPPHLALRAHSGAFSMAYRATRGNCLARGGNAL